MPYRHRARRGGSKEWGRLVSIADRLDEDPNLDVAPAYLCLSHIWQRLRVWSPGRDSPMMHPDAVPPILLP